MPENRKKTGNATSWRPGQSGNPGGRPKTLATLRARCRDAVDEFVIQQWIETVRVQGDGWVKCSELLAAYGYGKPEGHPIEDEDVQTSAPPEEDLTTLELRKLVALEGGKK